jgi:hypothetical protein
MMRETVVVGILALLALPLAAAQNLDEPLRNRVEEKSSAATSDPKAFLVGHASEGAIAAEAEWAIAYGCFALEYAHDEAGTPDPDLEQCERYEEVLGIEPEPERPVAQVENLTEDAVAEVEEIADDVLESLDDIVEDPTSAPDVIIALLVRTVARILDAVQSIGASAEAVVDEALDLVGRALRADANAGAAVYARADELASSTGQAWTIVFTKAGALVDAGAEAASSVTQGLAAAASATLDAIARLVQSILDPAADPSDLETAKDVADPGLEVERVLGLLDEAQERIAGSV